MLSDKIWYALEKATAYMKDYIGKKYEHPETKETLIVRDYTLCGQLLMVNESKTESYSFWEEQVKEMRQL
jgi:ATP sulfurylase